MDVSNASAQVPARRATWRAHSAVRFVDLMRSEWVKLTSLPSLLIGVAGILAVGAGLPIVAGAMLDYEGPTTPDIPQSLYMIVGLPASLMISVAAVVGVIVSASEYSSGTVQSTALAAPKRVPSVLAKAGMAFVLTSLTAAIAVLGGWAASYPLFARFNLQLDLDTPGVALAVTGAIISVGLVAACGVGIGVIARSTTVGAVLMIMITFGSLLLVQLIPASIAKNVVGTFLLGLAAGRMTELASADAVFDIAAGQVSTLVAWCIVSGWAVATLALGAVLFARRDA